MTADEFARPIDHSLLAEYRRRGWALVPIPPGEKAPRIKNWQTRIFESADFTPGCNIGVIQGLRSGELVDVDLDCAEALALADTYLPPTRAEFGRASKLRAHRLHIAPGAHYECFGDPLLDGKNTILELRAGGLDGGSHQTVFPPSTHPSGEPIEWHRDIIAPTVFDAAKLRRRCTYLAIGCLTSRYVSRYAADRPGPDLPRLLWEADRALGRAAFRWLGQPDPDTPRRDETIELRWENGVFVPIRATTGILASIERRNCEEVFLRLLDKTAVEGQPVSSNTRSGNYAPKLFSQRPDRERFQKADFAWAMQALFAAGEITNEAYGRKGDERFRVARRQQEDAE